MTYLVGLELLAIVTLGIFFGQLLIIEFVAIVTKRSDKKYKEKKQRSIDRLREMELALLQAEMKEKTEEKDGFKSKDFSATGIPRSDSSSEGPGSLQAYL